MLTQDEVTKDIIKRLSAIPSVKGKPAAGSRIAEDLNMDSLAIMDFIMALEDGYDIALPLDRLAKIKTISELAKLIVQLDGDRGTR